MIRLKIEGGIVTGQCEVAPTHRVVIHEPYLSPRLRSAVLLDVSCHDCDDDARATRNQRDGRFYGVDMTKGRHEAKPLRDPQQNGDDDGE